MVDPMGEYAPLVRRLGGQVIEIAPDSPHHLNPMDVELNMAAGESPLSMKADFLLSLSHRLRKFEYKLLAISFLRLRAFTVTGGFEMATTKSMKIQAEIDKVKAKISEQQARLKELEQKKLEAENSEIVDIVRGMSISLTELPLLFEKLKDGGTLGQSVPKSEEEKKEEN